MADKFIAVVTGHRFDGTGAETFSCDKPNGLSPARPHSHQTPEAAATCGARYLRAVTSSAGHRAGATTRFVEVSSRVCREVQPGGPWLRYAVEQGLVNS